MAADAQYAIDVAATMVGGNETLAELDALTKQLLGGGRDADFFQDAMARVGKELESAAAAANVANAALKKGEEEYNALERAALQVSKAADKAALANDGVMPPEAVAFVKAGVAALEEQRVKLKGLEDAAKAAGAEETRLSKTQDNLNTLNGHVNKTLAGQAESYEKLRFGLSSIGGKLGQTAGNLLAPLQGFSKLSSEMGASKAAALAGAAGFAAIAAALVVVSIAAVAATVKVAGWAIGLADSYRSATLTQMALEQMHPELQALSTDFILVSNATGLHTDALEGLALQLKKAHVAASDMPAALRAAAVAEAALGQGGAQTFIDQINEGKKSVSALAAETQAKLGGIVSKQLLGLDAQTERFHDNIAGVFGGLNIEPALNGLHTLVAMFDQNTAAGRALKFLFNSIFQPLIDHAQDAAYTVEAFYLGALIGGVKLYIALKPVIKTLSSLFGFHDTSLTDVLTAAKKAGELIAPVFAVLAIGVAGLVAGVTAIGALIGTAIALIVAPIGLAIAGVLGLIDVFSRVWDVVSKLDFSSIGSNIISGLVAGLTPGPLLDAIGNVVGGAIDHAKKLLGIASPSKVFAEIGDNTVAGFTGAVEAGNDNAQAAISGMVDPAPAQASANDNGAYAAPRAAPAGAAAAGSSAPAGGAKGGSSIDLSGSTFVFNGVKDAEDAEAMFREMLTTVLEGDAAQLGATGTDGAK